MTVSRRNWWSAASSQARVGRVEAFGWVVHRHVLPIGSSMVIVAASEVSRKDAPNMALYVRGRASVTHEDGTVFEDRVPGLFTAERPDHPVGIVTVKAVEETEFWCFNWHANRRAMPAALPIRMPAGGTWRAASGQRVLVCSGALDEHWAGDSFVADGGDMEAAPGTYGFEIGGDRG